MYENKKYQQRKNLVNLFIAGQKVTLKFTVLIKK